MVSDNPDRLLIVGAGFSANAGLPVASNFTESLLQLSGLNLTGPSRAQVKFLRGFVDRVFAEGARAQAKDWPELEDVFTMVDLSANTGHHLGPDFSASELRVVRRAILVRMIRMLAQKYKKGQDSDIGRQQLESLFTEFDVTSSAVLSMNWDTVFEQGIARAQGIDPFDYGCGAQAYRFRGDRLVERSDSSDAHLRILKPHGSVNWLYCDVCRQTFWVPPTQTESVARVLFRERDWTVVRQKTGLKAESPTVYETCCPRCESASLGTRFATFSYRKALDFPMHSASWRTAEAYLKDASDWIFIGYSLPAADFEFKHLLKRVQLSEKTRPDITVITGGDRKAAEATEARFRQFFGDVDGERFYFRNGLDAPVLKHLRSRGVMKQRTSKTIRKR